MGPLGVAGMPVITVDHIIYGFGGYDTASYDSWFTFNVSTLNPTTSPTLQPTTTTVITHTLPNPHETVASVESVDVDDSAPVAYRVKTRDSLYLNAEHAQEGAETATTAGMSRSSDC